MEVVVRVLEERHGTHVLWRVLGLGEHGPCVASAATAHKAQRTVEKQLRELLRDLPTAARMHLASADLPALHIVELALVIDGVGGRIERTGRFPVVVQRYARSTPSSSSELPPLEIAFHPQREEEWFPLEPGESLADTARRFFRVAWATLSTRELDELVAPAKGGRVRTLAIDTPVSTLLKERAFELDRKGTRRRPGDKVPLIELPRVSVDVTRDATDGRLPDALPRPALYERLRALLGDPAAGADGATRARSLLVVGEPGSGRTTLLEQAVRELLVQDDWDAHQNRDLVRHVRRLSATRLIAGMSHIGEWEARLLRVIEEARAHRVVLWWQDVHLLGRVGRSRESERSFADLLAEPVASGEIAIFGECTEDGLSRLSDETRTLARALPVLRVPAATRKETYQILLHAVRRLERERAISVPATALREIVETGAPLHPGLALPGRAMKVLARLADDLAVDAAALAARNEDVGEEVVVGRERVLGSLTTRTGLEPRVIDPDVRLDPVKLAAEVEASIVGQPEAREAVVDLVCRVKAGCTDARRPRAVYLFTGPTGTGKTETAKLLARLLYGSEERLLRFDMGELSGPDAVARLVGDRFAPDGRLTGAVRQQPFCVLLLDEIEKANRAVLHLLLQLFDEGRLTDASGTRTDFTHAVIVMTSNLGGRARPPVGFGEDPSAVLSDVARAVREFFPPELFNRIDRVVPFRPLDRAAAERIVRRELGSLLVRRGLAERRIAVSTTERVVERALAEAFDPARGARSVKRWIEREVGGLLAERIATSGRAEQRLVQVFAREGSGTLDARVTAIVEAEPRAPEPICSLGESAELAHLVAELARVAEPLAARPSDDALDVLESALSRALAEQRQKRDRSASLLSLGTAIESLRTLRDRIEQWTGTREERERERIADENELEPYELLSEGRVRRVRRVAAGAPTDRARRLTQAELREALLDALRVRRTLGLADDPDAHAVHVVLSRTGGGREPSWLLTELARAYASLASDVPFVVQRRGERPELVELERGEQLGGLVMLRLVGPAIARMMEPEQGTHLWERLEGAPQLVTVRVASAAETRPASEAFADMERELEAGRARFRDALERGASELPDDPDAPPALVRRYRISASDAEGFAYQIEDLATLQVAEGRARTLGQALAAVLDARAADARTLGEERT